MSARDVAARTAAEHRGFLLPPVAHLWRAPETLLVVLVWTAITVADLALSLSREKVHVSITEAARPLTPWVAVIERAALGFVLLACMAVVVWSWRRIDWSRWWVLALALAPWAVLAVSAALRGSVPGASFLLYPGLAAALWAARPRLAVIEVLGYITVGLALVAMLLALGWSDAGIFTGGQGFESEKPIGPWGILAGPLPTGNHLGRALALGLASVLTIRHLWARRVGVALTLIAILWSSSRAAWLVAAVVLLVWIASGMLRRSGAAGVAVARRGVLLALTGAALVAAGLPFVLSEPSALNNRVGYWVVTLEEWGRSPVFGRGHDFFAQLADSSDNLGGFAYHAHNLLVQLLITGGLVLVLCVAAMLLLAVRHAVRELAEGRFWAVAFLLALACSSALEVPLSFVDNFGANLPALIPLLVLLSARTFSRDAGHDD